MLCWGARPSRSLFATSRCEHFPSTSGVTPDAACGPHALPFERESAQLHPDNPVNDTGQAGTSVTTPQTTRGRNPQAVTSAARPRFSAARQPWLLASAVIVQAKSRHEPDAIESRSGDGSGQVNDKLGCLREDEVLFESPVGW